MEISSHRWIVSLPAQTANTPTGVLRFSYAQRRLGSNRTFLEQAGIQIVDHDYGRMNRYGRVTSRVTSGLVALTANWIGLCVGHGDGWTHWGSVPATNAVSPRLATDGTNIYYSTLLEGVFRATLVDKVFALMPMTGFPLWDANSNTNGFGLWNLAVTPSGQLLISGSPINVTSNNASPPPAPFNNTILVFYYWDEADSNGTRRWSTIRTILTRRAPGISLSRQTAPFGRARDSPRMPIAALTMGTVILHLTSTRWCRRIICRLPTAKRRLVRYSRSSRRHRMKSSLARKPAASCTRQTTARAGRASIRISPTPTARTRLGVSVTPLSTDSTNMAMYCARDSHSVHRIQVCPTGPVLR